MAELNKDQDDLHFDDEIEEETKNYISEEDILQVNNIVKSFEGLIAVNQVSFQVNKGELVGIIGPNGAGKTTLFNVLTGFLKPDQGNIIFKNKNITKYKPEKIAKMGMVRSFQRARPFKLMTATQNTIVPHVSRRFFQTPKTLKNRATWSLISVDLGEKKNFPAMILSHGDLKRLDFARAMALKPDMLLLDEPFAGLSAEESFRVERIIKEARKDGMTAIIVEHKLHILMKIVDRVIVINQGKIIANGPPEKIVKDEGVIKAYLGVEVNIG